jgi:hypothetical protein
MRIRDLKFRGLSAWPVEWSETSGQGVLKKVWLSKGTKPTNIHIEANYVGATLKGVIVLEDHDYIVSLYNVLKKNIGKPLLEIGYLEIDYY